MSLRDELASLAELMKQDGLIRYSRAISALLAAHETEQTSKQPSEPGRTAYEAFCAAHGVASRWDQNAPREAWAAVERAVESRGMTSEQAARERLGRILASNSGFYWDIRPDVGFAIRDIEECEPVAVAARPVRDWADACAKACEAFEREKASIRVIYGNASERKADG